MADAPLERGRRLGHRADAPVPLSTYRLQLTADFTFADAERHLGYFASLGVSHLYLSPILTAAPGSTHFYDVVDHSRVSQVLGGEQGLRSLAAAAAALGIGLIADVVPNHMAVPTPVYHNQALWSVLAHGPESPFAPWFDVDWSGAEPVLMPVLGARIGTVLARGELSLDTMVVPGLEDDGPTTVLRYYEHVFPVRPGTENLPLDALVSAQHYRLAYWRVGNEELNYRRFFDVGALVGVRVEDTSVFAATHRLLLSLLDEGVLDGLRVDHPDGLADPETYLSNLADASGGRWTIVEKLLEEEEHLPATWKVAGTTGYEALWRVGALLRDPAGAAPLGGTMYHLTGDALGSLPALIEQSKREVVDESLAAEVRRLASRAHELCHADVRLRDHTWASLDDCLRAMLVAFGRYRAYVNPGRPTPRASLEAIDDAAVLAAAMLDDERHETLELVVDLLKGLEVGSAGRQFDAARLELITRFEQAAGAVMAKGVEDTTYYRWTHLLSLCEVGSPAQHFALPPASFHAWNQARQVAAPHGLTTLSTHDAKRSEDTRARIGVLSEFSAEWDAWLMRARAATEPLRPTELDGRMESLWWQTLIGTVDEGGEPMAWPRLESFVVKAMREAKTHTSWTSMDQAYESAVLWFTQTCHADPQVRDLLREWTALTADAVRTAVLSQKLIQLTMPGIPDVYQGTETLRPLLVDPDNRLAPDFDALRRQLEGIDRGGPVRGLAQEKLLVTTTALRHRRLNAEACTGAQADYFPLAASSDHAVVFARFAGDSPRLITVATRLQRELDRLGGWGEHTVTLPDGQWRDALTGRVVDGGAQAIGSILASLPVALLVAQ